MPAMTWHHCRFFESYAKLLRSQMERERKKKNKKELERGENNFASIKFDHSRKRPSLFGHLTVGLVGYMVVYCRGLANTGGAT